MSGELFKLGQTALEFLPGNILAVDSIPAQPADVLIKRIGRKAGLDMLAALSALMVAYVVSITVFVVTHAIFNPNQGRRGVFAGRIVGRCWLTVSVPLMLMALHINNRPSSVRARHTGHINEFLAAFEYGSLHGAIITAGVLSCRA